MEKKKKFIMIACVTLVILGGGSGMYFVYQNHVKEVTAEKARTEKHAKQLFDKLFIDKKLETVNADISYKDVKLVEDAFKEVDDEYKKPYLKRLANIRQYISVRNQIKGYFVKDVMKSTITDKDIESANTLCATLEKGFQAILNKHIDMMIAQRDAMKKIEELSATFFVDGVVRDDIDTESFASFKDKLEALPQRDIADSYGDKVVMIEAKIAELEEIERQRVEAQRQAAIQRALEESERLRRQNEEIAAANVILPNVPLIDQRNGVLNGCEVASLLMGMQYKGYHQGMTLHEIAEVVPKTDDPYTGFVLDIWGSLPNDKPHWIAPSALASFGQTYYSGVVDISGSSVDQLKAEIDAGNPVIVYATYGFFNPTGWYTGIPVNQHVMLMVGYNKRTGNIIINDPWGGEQMTVSLDSFTKQYSLKTFAVAIH